MKNKQNLHIHTTYADGRDTPEQIVTAAIEQGFDSIGFSEHSYLPCSSYTYQMTPEDTVKYMQEIASLKARYKGRIDIFCGMEFDLHSDVPTDGFDYLIGSVHYLDFGGRSIGFDRGLNQTLDYVSDNFGGDGLAFAKKYFETLPLLPEKRKFDIIGHFDIITKNNEAVRFIDTSSQEYLNMGYEAIHALRGRIPFFELNTGAIARGYRSSPYPQMEFLKEFRRLGFGAVITSDCHDRRYLDCFYGEGRELLAAAGFSSRWILTEDGFTEVSL